MGFLNFDTILSDCKYDSLGLSPIAIRLFRIIVRFSWTLLDCDMILLDSLRIPMRFSWTLLDCDSALWDYSWILSDSLGFFQIAMWLFWIAIRFSWIANMILLDSLGLRYDSHGL